MKKEIIILLAIVAVIAVAGMVGASYYRDSVQKPAAPGKKTPDELLRADSPSLGPPDAKVTIVEFYDPECESCAKFHPIVKGLMKEFEGKVKFVSRYATFHKNARLAALYTEAAGQQGNYWEMRETLFEKQDEWGEKHGAAPTTPAVEPSVLFDKYAKDLGMNVDQLKAAVADPKTAVRIDRDMQDVDTLKVNRTPTFYVNGRLLARLTQLDLRALIVQEIEKQP